MVLQMRAVFTLIVIGTFAEVVRGQVETLRTILTWVGLAVIDIQLTQLPREASRTQTLKSIDFILTPATAQAGTASTLVHVLVTVFTRIARSAKTAVTIHQILASSSIQTLTLAVIYVYITILTRPARETLAEICTNQIVA